MLLKFDGYQLTVQTLRSVGIASTYSDMSAFAPKMPSGRRTRKTHKSRHWWTSGSISTRSLSRNSDRDVQCGKTATNGVFFICSEDEGRSESTVEMSGRSLPSSQLSPTARGGSFSLTRKKEDAYADDGYPPNGYLRMWTGVLRRWHRQYFNLETPGVLTYAHRKGEQISGALCLRDARVVPSRGNPKQFCIVTPSGVAYLRSIRIDQRAPWISHIRASIEKYAQCVEQAHRSRHTLDLAIEPEEAKLDKEVKARVQQKMNELLPHQAALKWQMTQLVKKIHSVKEILGDTDRDVRSRTETLKKQPSPRLVSVHENRLIRHTSLAGELPGMKSEVRRRRLKAKSKDDLAVRPRSSLDAHALREKAKLRKCRTPIPMEPRRWQSPKHSPRDESDTIISKRSIDSPCRPDSVINDAGVWHSYKNFLDAVQRLVQKEVQDGLEMEMENLALKRMLEIREDDGVHLRPPIPQPSRSTSRSYSTAESEFDTSLLENSDEDDRLHSTSRTSTNTEVLDALDVVRRAEYVAGHDNKNAGLMLNFQGMIPPGTFETDYDEESNLEVRDLHFHRQRGQIQGSGEMEMETVRTRLPAPRPLRRGFHLWNILRNAIGFDLTRITMPATINEPLSAIQRFVEEFEHATLLTRAAHCPHAHERLLLVTAFVLSSYYAALPRDSKPFNPLLGETFEWQNEHFRFLGEQVSHHPPVACFHVQGFDPKHDTPIYEVHGEFELKSKFWGKSLHVFPTGRIELFLATTEERFVWNKAGISIHNLVMGQLWLDIQGDVQIENLTTGDCAVIKLLKTRNGAMDRGNLEGKIVTAEQKEVYSIDGNFTKAVYARRHAECNREEIFRVTEMTPFATEQYNMTPFAVRLNDLGSYEIGELPKTDSRFRPDVRSLEIGDIAFATSEKLRLEEKQRKTRKARKKNGQKYVPMWFALRRQDVKDISKALEQRLPPVWKFREEYWHRKAAQSWEGCRDIY